MHGFCFVPFLVDQMVVVLLFVGDVVLVVVGTLRVLVVEGLVLSVVVVVQLSVVLGGWSGGVGAGEGCTAGSGSSESDDELLESEDDEGDDDAELDLRVPAASGVFSASGSPLDSGRCICAPRDSGRGGGFDEDDDPGSIPGPSSGSSICIH